MSTRYCYTPNCDGEVGENSTIGLCKNCYASMYYWHKKSPKALIERAQKLQIYRGRMDLLMPSATDILPYSKPKKPLQVMPGEFKKLKKRKTKRAA